MAPDLFLHPVFDEAEALAVIKGRKQKGLALDMISAAQTGA
jgi:hypothetical protein